MEAGRKNGHASIRLTILRVDKQQAAHEWELVRAFRFAVAAEFESAQMYMQLAKEKSS